MRKVSSKIANLAAEIMLFLRDKGEVVDFGEEQFLISTGAYAEAVNHLRESGGNPKRCYFSCNNSLLLKNAAVLQKRYSLEILSTEEGMRRERNLRLEGVPFGRSWTTGSQALSKQLHQGAEITDAEWYGNRPIIKKSEQN